MPTHADVYLLNQLILCGRGWSRMTSSTVLAYDHLVKLLLIGNSGVGKTSLLLRYVDDTFSTTFITTIGIDFRIKTIDINGKRVKLQIWDTAGQERFRTIAVSYYRGAMGILVVFDVTNRSSFTNLSEWLEHIKTYAQADIEKVLVGNKCDLTEQRTVTEDEAKEYAKTLGVPLLQTSSKAGTNISEIFELLASLIIKKMASRGKSPPKDDNIRINDDNTNSASTGEKKCSC